jgi:transposase-like protein
MSKGERRGASPAAEGGRRPTGVAGDAGADRGRWSSRRKLEIVLRLLKGEDLDAVSREVGITASRLARWRDEALGGAQRALKSRLMTAEGEEVSRLKSKVGELTMDNELLEERLRRLGDPAPPRLRRSRR